MRDSLFRGMTRFSEFERSLDIAPNILIKRLGALVDAGLLAQRPRLQDGETLHYFPTEKGMDIKAVIIALTSWGDKWAAPNGAPVFFQHKECLGRIEIATKCAKCGIAPAFTEINAAPTKSKAKKAKSNAKKKRPGS